MRPSRSAGPSGMTDVINIRRSSFPVLLSPVIMKPRNGREHPDHMTVILVLVVFQGTTEIQPERHTVLIKSQDTPAFNESVSI